MREKSSREVVEEKQPEVWYDRAFVRALQKSLAKHLPEVGAMIFEEQKIIVFFYRRVIIHKILLDEFNTQDVERHVNLMRKIVTRIKLGAINIKPLVQPRLNERKTGKALN